MRFWFVCALALMFAANATLPSNSAEANKVGAPGDSYVVELGGNPSTGYRWKLSEPGSVNLGILRVHNFNLLENSFTDSIFIPGLVGLAELCSIIKKSLRPLLSILEASDYAEIAARTKMLIRFFIEGI